MQNSVNDSTPSSRWGGSRKGAGRKKMEKGKYYGFNSTPEVEAILEAVDGSKSRFINDAILSFSRHSDL